MRPTLAIFLVAFACTRFAAAQTPSAAGVPFAVLDNSFLVEEAFNQEAGVVQNIVNWARDTEGAWYLTFTQEWPLINKAHQGSYTIPFSGGAGVDGHVGGVLLNYRYQVSEEERGLPAIAARATAILPTGSSDDGSDLAGLQTNLALSRQLGDLYVHANVGFTWLPGVAVSSGDDRDLFSPQIAASAIWRLRPMLHLMVEGVGLFQQSVDESAAVTRDTVVTIAPGLRQGWNVGKTQFVIGAAVPITSVAGTSTTAFLLYGSYELPFK